MEVGCVANRSRFGSDSHARCQPKADPKNLRQIGRALGRLEVPKVDLQGARLNRIFWSIYSQSLPS